MLKQKYNWKCCASLH